jgi:hypothetical protein
MDVDVILIYRSYAMGMDRGKRVTALRLAAIAQRRRKTAQAVAATTQRWERERIADAALGTRARLERDTYAAKLATARSTIGTLSAPAMAIDKAPLFTPTPDPLALATPLTKSQARKLRKRGKSVRARVSADPVLPSVDGLAINGTSRGKREAGNTKAAQREANWPTVDAVGRERT